ncbi:MAG: class I SAM-dependent methyltransferase [Acidobacteriota bacterium]
MRRLNLGCGRDRRSGYVNLDVVRVPGVDVIADLERPLPFRSATFDEVIAVHTLEHVTNLLPLLRELWRIAGAGAVIRITVPHLSFFGAYTDPTHRRFFGYHSFDYFTEDGVYNFYSDLRFRIRRRQILFYWIKNEKREVPGRLLTWLINRFPLFYERFLCWMLPANELYFELEPLKPV